MVNVLCPITMQGYFLSLFSGSSGHVLRLKEQRRRAVFSLAEKLRNEYPEEFVLWLYHRNDTILNYPKLPVELVLSGHAHGGIIRLPGLGGLLDVRASFGAEYENGVYTLGDLTLLVSRGLGNSVMIPRFLNRPELPIITLKTKT